MSRVRSIGPRGLGATLSGHAASFSPVASAFGLPPIDWAAPKHFTFRRRRTAGVWGWEVGLQVGRLWVNLSTPDAGPGRAPFLRRLAEAHGWAISFAERHGFKPMQAQKPPRKKPRPVLTVVDGGSP